MGPVTKALLQKWGKNVGVDIIAQIKKFNQEFEECTSDTPTPYRFVP
jgi:hypothetical protein